MSTTYEVSSSYVAGLVKVLKAEGHLDAVLAQVGVEGQRAIAEPLANRWWDGAVMDQLMGALQKIRGDAVVERVSFSTLKAAMGPLVMPLVKVTLAITGSTPDALLTRSGQFLSISVRGLNVTWTPTGASAGTYVVQYPVKVTRAYLPLWKGMLGYVFELTQVRGTVENAVADLDGRTFRYTFSWK